MSREPKAGERRRGDKRLAELHRSPPTNIPGAIGAVVKPFRFGPNNRFSLQVNHGPEGLDYFLQDSRELVFVGYGRPREPKITRAKSLPELLHGVYAPTCGSDLCLFDWTDAQERYPKWEHLRLGPWDPSRCPQCGSPI